MAFAVLSAIFAVLSAAYWVYLGIKTKFTASVMSFWLVSAAVFSFLALCDMTDCFGSFAVLAAAWALRCAVLLFVITLFAVFFSNIIIASKTSDAAGILVLGANVDGSLPRSIAASRADKASELIKSIYPETVVVTGGGGEAEYLSKKIKEALPGITVAEEKTADTTVRNFEFSLKMMPQQKIAVVTSGYHITRAFITARSAFPAREFVMIPAKNDLPFLLHCLCREVICFFVDIRKGNIKI